MTSRYPYGHKREEGSLCFPILVLLHYNDGLLIQKPYRLRGFNQQAAPSARSGMAQDTQPLSADPLCPSNPYPVLRPQRPALYHDSNPVRRAIMIVASQSFSHRHAAYTSTSLCQAKALFHPAIFRNRAPALHQQPPMPLPPVSRSSHLRH